MDNPEQLRIPYIDPETEQAKIDFAKQILVDLIEHITDSYNGYGARLVIQQAMEGLEIKE